jgi:hypothetical protein
VGDFLRSAELSSLGAATTSDAQGKALIAMAEAQVRTYCGWHISAETVVDQQVTPIGDDLFLPTLHLTGVTSVVGNGIAYPSGSAFYWRPNGQVKLFPMTSPDLAFGMWIPPAGRWPLDFLVSYSHGYPSGAPQLLVVKQVVLSMVSRLLESPDQRLISSQVGQIIDTFSAPPQVPSGLTYAEQGALAALRLPTVA